MNTLFRRRFHAFLSYSHEDRDIAKKLFLWLKTAKFEIWFDEHNLEAGSSVAKDLAEKFSDCRAWMILASKNSLASDWVNNELKTALDCVIENSDFNLIILRIDNIDIREDWPSLKQFKWLEMPGGILNHSVAREIINRLDGRVWSGRQPGLRDMYISHGWNPADLPFADAVCNGLCASKWMLRLVGDMPDQPSFSEQRVREIMSTCWGHLLILPRRDPTDQAYRYFIRELNISANLGIPTLLIAEADTQLPVSLSTPVCYLVPQKDYRKQWLREPPLWLENFLDELKEPSVSQHVFLAAEYRKNIRQVKYLQEFIESVTGRSCYIGQNFEGQGLTDQIISSISSASIVIANLASFEDNSPNISNVNLNTCVEAGIALGASFTRTISGDTPLPVILIAKSPEEMGERMDKLPFMFRDSQINWYSNEAILLGMCRKLLRPYRWRIINYEFTKSV